MRQTLCYDYFYRQTQGQTDQEIQTVLLLAKQPQAGTLAKFAYEATAQAGVYRDSHWLLNNIPILSLNELPNEPHNAWVKCFASHRTEKLKAFTLRRQLDWQMLTVELEWFLAALWQYWFTSIGDDVNQKHLEITPEQLNEVGKFWGPIYLSKLSAEERLAGLSSEDMLSRLKPEDLFGHFKPEDLLGYFKPEERLRGLKPEERLSGLKPEERLSGLKPEDMLNLLNLDEIEAYLRQRRNHAASQTRG